MLTKSTILLTLATIGCAAPGYYLSDDAARALAELPPEKRDRTAVAARRADGERAVWVRAGALLPEQAERSGAARWVVKADDHPLTKAGRPLALAAPLYLVAGSLLFADGDQGGRAVGLTLLIAGAVLAALGDALWLAGEVEFPREVEAKRRGYTFLGAPP